ncbi:Crp/Fnr family transcriptional regulator [Haliscomenobacter sp.]|uniref:Crp/Fnr family transcriptional regulator n=1 Tax=Haliscomenobacter sp. TaxID=2717303 RepID=UPI003BA845BF
MREALIIQNISRHISLNEAECNYFLSLLEFKSLKRKGFLIQPGELCRYEHFITKGCLRTYTIDENGFEHILMFAIEDWWTGDLYSFLTQTPASLFIDALEDTELLVISKHNLEKLYVEIPKFERFFRIILQNAFVAQQQRINQNLSFSAEQRYLHFIDKFPTLEQRIPQRQIAAYLGITPEFLSMIRRKLARK